VGHDTVHAAEHAQRRVGLAYGFAAYGCWGVLPLYFKAVDAAPPLELLSHRVVWAVLLLLGLCVQGGLMGQLRSALRPGRVLGLLCASTALIGFNWLIYISAIVSGHVLEASLGYYINPLVNILLGVAVFRERLPRPVLWAVLIAAAGVAWLTASVGRPPWISLALAFSFALYGLARKLAPVGAVVGLTVETGLLCPLALAWLLWSAHSGQLVFRSQGMLFDLLLLMAGPLTAIPLLFFTGAARRLPLTTIGFLQYVSPTLQFLMAALLFGEPFTRAHGVAFACIWVALALVALHAARRARSL
jgi:chloramphenicol-sensitive protein RarD